MVIDNGVFSLNPLENNFWDSQNSILLFSTDRVAEHQHTRLVLKDAPDKIPRDFPLCRDLTVFLGGAESGDDRNFSACFDTDILRAACAGELLRASRGNGYLVRRPAAEDAGCKCERVRWETTHSTNARQLSSHTLGRPRRRIPSPGRVTPAGF